MPVILASYDRYAFGYTHVTADDESPFHHFIINSLGSYNDLRDDGKFVNKSFTNDLNFWAGFPDFSRNGNVTLKSKVLGEKDTKHDIKLTAEVCLF